MKFSKIILLINIFFIIVSCGTVKEAFTNQKKNSADEFLVEKKSPLVMPPDYNELPVPEAQTQIKDEKNEIRTLITKSEMEIKKQEDVNISQNFEENVLKKMKNNNDN